MIPQSPTIITTASPSGTSHTDDKQDTDTMLLCSVKTLIHTPIDSPKQQNVSDDGSDSMRLTTNESSKPEKKDNIDAVGSSGSEFAGETSIRYGINRKKIKCFCFFACVFIQNI